MFQYYLFTSTANSLVSSDNSSELDVIKWGLKISINCNTCLAEQDTFMIVETEGWWTYQDDDTQKFSAEVCG